MLLHQPTSPAVLASPIVPILWMDSFARLTREPLLILLLHLSRLVLRWYWLKYRVSSHSGFLGNRLRWKESTHTMNWFIFTIGDMWNFMYHDTWYTGFKYRLSTNRDHRASGRVSRNRGDRFLSRTLQRNEFKTEFAAQKVLLHEQHLLFRFHHCRPLLRLPYKLCVWSYVCNRDRWSNVTICKLRNVKPLRFLNHIWNWC